MSEYLLPCTCGQKQVVSVRQAGQTVTCSCGTVLEVPTLRGLRELEPADRPAVRQRAWENRHRAVFVFVAIALGALAVAGYLQLSMPAEREPMQLIDVDENTPIDLAYEVYQDLLRGLDTEPPGATPFEQGLAQRRARMLWGVRIALVVAAGAGIGAIGVLLSARSQKR